MHMKQYWCSHVVAGHVLIFLATASDEFILNYYLELNLQPKYVPYFGLIFFCTAYLTLTMVYIAYYPMPPYGYQREMKHLVLCIHVACLLLAVKVYICFFMLMMLSSSLGFFMGFCNLFLLFKKNAMKRFFYNIYKYLRFRCKRRRRGILRVRFNARGA